MPGSSSSPRNPTTGRRSTAGLAITLDDILIEDGQIAPFDRSGPTFTAMGRFGNVMLTNGETDYRAEAKVGEVVRLHLVDTANTRIFNFAITGARMKLVGGDSGRVEREEFIDEILLSPSERAIVDVLFEQPGEVILENRTPDHTYELGRIRRLRRGPRQGRGSFRRATCRSRAHHRARAHPGSYRPRARQDPVIRLTDADPLRR